MTTPKEITMDPKGNKQIASFGYYDGLQYVKEKGLKQTTSFKEVFNNTRHFIVCCGDVMVNVEPTDFPEIERRVI
jgi:hypothetical protein